jgi:hypothetical protein
LRASRGIPEGLNILPGDASTNEGEKLERKFESELGERVVEKNGHRNSKKVSALIGAVAVCTLMISCAFVSLADNQPAKDSGVMFDNHVDYIYGVDDEVDVKRTMTLKNKTMEVSGTNELTYTSFNYSVSISVNDVGLSWVNAIIGSLTIAIDGATSSNEYTGNYLGYIELTGPGLEILQAPVSGSVTCGADPGSVTFLVPQEFDVFVTDMSKLSLNVTLTFGVGFLSGDVTESGDPRLEGEYVANGATLWGLHSDHNVMGFDPMESYPGPQWLF